MYHCGLFQCDSQRADFAPLKNQAMLLGRLHIFCWTGKLYINLAECIAYWLEDFLSFKYWIVTAITFGGATSSRQFSKEILGKITRNKSTEETPKLIITSATFYILNVYSASWSREMPTHQGTMVPRCTMCKQNSTRQTQTSDGSMWIISAHNRYNHHNDEPSTAICSLLCEYYYTYGSLTQFLNETSSIKILCSLRHKKRTLQWFYL